MYCSRAESCVDKPCSCQNKEVVLKSIVQLYLAVSFKASCICVPIFGQVVCKKLLLKLSFLKKKGEIMN